VELGQDIVNGGCGHPQIFYVLWTIVVGDGSSTRRRYKVIWVSAKALSPKSTALAQTTEIPDKGSVAVWVVVGKLPRALAGRYAATNHPQGGEVCG
jgi:hypothetical protein